MTGFYGADTEQVRALSQKFRQSSARLGQLTQELTQAVASTSWDGKDAEQFRSDFYSNVTTRMPDISRQLGMHALNLDGQAADQDRISSLDPRTGWEKLVDLGKRLAKVGGKAFGAYKGAKSLFEGAKDMKRLWQAYKMGPEDFDRVWNSLKLRNHMQWEQSGFAKLFKSVGPHIPGNKIPGFLMEKAGKVIDEIPSKVGEGGRLVEKIGAKLGPEGLSKLGKASKLLGKAVPLLDIGVGAYQMTQASDGYGKVSGALSVAGGALMLAGVAFPPLAVVGGALSLASVGMDLVDMGGELFGKDPSKAVSEAVSKGFDSAKNAVGDAAGKVGDAIGGLGNKLGSIFG